MMQIGLQYDRSKLELMFNQMAVHAEVEPFGIEDIELQNKLLLLSKESLELNSSDVLLDAGCGIGDVAILLANSVKQVIGIDISRESLRIATLKAKSMNINNVTFQYAGIEDGNLDSQYNKILLLRTLHHLTDDLKERALMSLCATDSEKLRIVIGDLMWFDNPNEFRHEWDMLGYDGGLTDHPCTVDFLTNTLSGLNFHLDVKKIHPMMGIITATRGKTNAKHR